MKGNLCIGGPWDGVWHYATGNSFEVGTPIRGRQGRFTPTDVSVIRHTYARHVLNIANRKFAVWITADMSQADAVARLIENYKPPEAS
jgi:hypothetical protein